MKLRIKVSKKKNSFDVAETTEFGSIVRREGFPDRYYMVVNSDSKPNNTVDIVDISNGNLININWGTVLELVADAELNIKE